MASCCPGHATSVAPARSTCACFPIVIRLRQDMPRTPPSDSNMPLGSVSPPCHCGPFSMLLLAHKLPELTPKLSAALPLDAVRALKQSHLLTGWIHHSTPLPHSDNKQRKSSIHESIIDLLLFLQPRGRSPAVGRRRRLRADMLGREWLPIYAGFTSRR